MLVRSKRTHTSAPLPSIAMRREERRWRKKGARTQQDRRIEEGKTADVTEGEENRQGDVKGGEETRRNQQERRRESR